MKIYFLPLPQSIEGVLLVVVENEVNSTFGREITLLSFLPSNVLIINHYFKSKVKSKVKKLTVELKFQKHEKRKSHEYV